MESDSREIKQLIKQCKKQKRSAQKKLYKLFYSYGMSVCMRYSPTREDAVEILNDGFMNVFTYLDSFKNDKPFKPWLRRILINCALDHNRKNHKLSFSDMGEQEYIEAESNEFNRMDYNDLLSMIRQLPPSYGIVFNLKAVEGYKHEEIADILGISVGTSKSNYAKARVKLREALNEYFGVKHK